MARSTTIKAGVAFAAVGVLALTPAIVPPMSPEDHKVAAKTQVSLTATQDPFQQLIINQFFAIDGPFAILRDQIIARMATEEQRVLVFRAFNDTFGAILRDQIIARLGSEEQAQFVFTLFNEGPIANLRDFLVGATGDPVQAAFIEDAFNISAAEILKNQLVAATEDEQQQQFIKDLFGAEFDEEGNPLPAGPVYILRNTLYNATSDPDQQEFIATNFDEGPVAYLRDRLAGATGDPVQAQFINDVFNISPAEIVMNQLVAGFGEDSEQSKIITKLFKDGGPFEVVRYLLAGDIPPAEDPDDEGGDDEGGEETTLQRVATFSAPEVTTPEPPKAPEPVATPVAAVTPAAPAAPAAAPAAEPEKPKFTAKIREAEPEAETAEVDTKGGNKATPEIIVPTGGTTGGATWDPFGDIVRAVGSLVQGALTPGGPGATPAGGSTADAGGAGGAGGGTEG